MTPHRAPPRHRALEEILDIVKDILDKGLRLRGQKRRYCSAPNTLRNTAS